ncbi:MAG: phytanoyl-CoA dioxygenase family protein [Tunicatimonas sp.]|uniref:phytanoyl-CoA dioxygenase family protein n=1 Tax=Tunicatimonas sp. TaxID=1940096 RepID=UPI003C726DC7
MTITQKQRLFFEKNGYLKVSNLMTSEEVDYYRDLYEEFLSNRIDVSRYRSDLGSHAEQPASLTTERITQIMTPFRIMTEPINAALHQKTLFLAQQLLGDDMALDFDMLIDKAPFSNTPTPWHQDCAYWIDLPDKRAVSCWVRWMKLNWITVVCGTCRVPIFKLCARTGRRGRGEVLWSVGPPKKKA